MTTEQDDLVDPIDEAVTEVAFSLGEKFERLGVARETVLLVIAWQPGGAFTARGSDPRAFGTPNLPAILRELSAELDAEGERVRVSMLEQP